MSTEMTKAQKTRQAELYQRIRAYELDLEINPPAPMSLDDVAGICPAEDFDWHQDEIGDMNVYHCGESDCPVGWHEIGYVTHYFREGGKLTIEVEEVDQDGNWDINCAWSDDEPWDGSDVASFFGSGGTDDYFKGWAQYWLDCAETGEDPCTQAFGPIKVNWSDFCLDAAEGMIKYLGNDR